MVVLPQSNAYLHTYQVHVSPCSLTSCNRRLRAVCQQIINLCRLPPGDGMEKHRQDNCVVFKQDGKVHGSDDMAGRWSPGRCLGEGRCCAILWYMYGFMLPRWLVQQGRLIAFRAAVISKYHASSVQRLVTLVLFSRLQQDTMNFLESAGNEPPRSPNNPNKRILRKLWLRMTEEDYRTKLKALQILHHTTMDLSSEANVR